jgi:hypothetical protein
MSWLENLIVQSASAISAAGNSVRGFGMEIDERLQENPLTDWELKYWSRGLQRGLIVLNGHWFRMGSGKFSSYSFFVRNEHGLHVGLRRESIAQAAAYVSLITQYGYSRRRVRFETGYMDVAVRNEWGQTVLYAESKASCRTLERLIDHLTSDYREGLPGLAEGENPSDAWQKAGHILRHRPDYFWAVSPQFRRAFKINYLSHGFLLYPLPDIPVAQLDGLFKTKVLKSAARRDGAGLSDGSLVSLMNLAASLS